MVTGLASVRMARPLVQPVMTASACDFGRGESWLEISRSLVKSYLGGSTKRPVRKRGEFTRRFRG